MSVGQGVPASAGREPTRLETEIHHLEATRAMLNALVAQVLNQLANLRGTQPPELLGADKVEEVDPSTTMDRLGRVGADITNLTEKLNRQLNELGELV